MKYSIVITVIVLIASIVSIPVVFSEDDWREYRQHSIGVAAVSSPVYKAECSSCHMAYPPGLLPARSWKKIMGSLDMHFGDNAELAPEAFKQVSEFLLANSADTSDYRRSRKIISSLSNTDVPVRITETPYIVKKHDELPDKMVKFNDKVRSLSNCNACHARAEQGIFSEHSVNIPGFGRWDD